MRVGELNVVMKLAIAQRPDLDVDGKERIDDHIDRLGTEVATRQLKRSFTEEYWLRSKIEGISHVGVVVEEEFVGIFYARKTPPSSAAEPLVVIRAFLNTLKPVAALGPVR